MKLQFAAVVAYSQNRVIGIHNQLPWHLPDDLKHFKSLTLNHPVLMGRKTFESIGRPLPNRQNFVLSSQKDLHLFGCEVISSPCDMVKQNLQCDKVMVIGGEQVYRVLLPQCRWVYATEIAVTLEGDAFFPELDGRMWQEVARSHHPADSRHRYAFDFVTYERKQGAKK